MSRSCHHLVENYALVRECGWEPQQEFVSRCGFYRHSERPSPVLCAEVPRITHSDVGFPAD